MKTPPDTSSWRRLTLSGAAVLAVLAGLGVLYGRSGGPGNGVAAHCAPARAIAGRIAPLAKGELAALRVLREPGPLPALSFNDASGRAVSLEDFRGRTVLFNLWATWCIPCRQEMPALASLQKALGGPDFEVVAVNIDTRNPERARNWLADNKVDGLAFFADSTAKVFQELKQAGKATGMPTTVLISPQGCEIANLAGPAEWASPDALALVRAALER